MKSMWQETSEVGMSEKMTLLLIDDEPDIIEMLFGMLDHPGHDILLANNGEEALELLKEYPVDAILSDIRMPKMGGIEMVKRVRALGLATPIVMMTGQIDHRTTLEALRAGVLDVIEKPFPRAKLVMSIERALVLGVNVRKVYAELQKFCDDRHVHAKYVDVMKYLSVFFVQQEVERAQQKTAKVS